MDRDSLIDAIGFTIKDPYSADTITLRIDTAHGLYREELYLKEMGSPTPKLEVYGNIPCVLIRSETSTERASIIFSHAGKPSELIDIPWVRKAAGAGTKIVGADIDPDETHANATARILRVVSYLCLRKDIIDPDRIFLFGNGIYGMWALVAGIIDERVAGVILVDPMFELSLSNGQPLITAQLGGLLSPRPLAILGIQNPETVFADTMESYKGKGQEFCLRLEEGNSDDLLDEVSQWMLRKEER